MLLFKNTPLIWGLWRYLDISVIIVLHNLAPPTVKSHWFKIIYIYKYVLIDCDFASFKCVCFQWGEKSHLIRYEGRLVELWVNYGLGLAEWCHKWLAVAFLLLHSPSTPAKTWQMWKSLVQEGQSGSSSTHGSSRICFQYKWRTETCTINFFHFCSVIYKKSYSKHEIRRLLPFIINIYDQE